jgi:hypothetical protein
MFAVVTVAGCSILEDNVARGYAQNGRFATAATFTTADIRIITQREHPVFHHQVICTEPSPDVAKALSAALEAAGQGGNAGTTGSFGFGGSSAETVQELAGRSTALLGLRDGLYRACEAYANGAIGADAYALVLSRYGQLMTTLFLAQDITGAAGTEARAAAQSPSITVNVPGGGSATAGQAQTPGGATTSSAPIQITSNPPNSTGALALARINEDYFNLDYNLAQLLAVACINEGDYSRLHSPTETPLAPPSAPLQLPGNPWLSMVCPQLADMKVFKSVVDDAKTLGAAHILAPPVNPAAVIPAAPPAKTATTSKSRVLASAQRAPTPAQIMLAQQRLRLAGLNPAEPPNGMLDQPTLAAVKDYQIRYKLRDTGELDAPTLKALGVP